MSDRWKEKRTTPKFRPQTGGLSLRLFSGNSTGRCVAEDLVKIKLISLAYIIMLHHTTNRTVE